MKVQALSTDRQDGVTMDAACGAAWENMRGLLRERFGETAYRRWLEPIAGAIISDDAGIMQATLTLPTRFMRDWVEAHYGDTIRTLWRQISKDGNAAFAVMSPLTKAAQTKSAIDTAAEPRPLRRCRMPRRRTRRTAHLCRRN